MSLIVIKSLNINVPIVLECPDVIFATMFECDCCFAPDSKHFVVAHAADVHVHSLAGGQMSKYPCPDAGY